MSAHAIRGRVMHLTILASGSKANAAILDTGARQILIDAGLSAQQIEVRMARVGLKPSDLGAILLTHEHADHTVGVERLARDFDIPVFANRMTIAGLKCRNSPDIDWRIFQTGQSFFAADIHIESFSVNHDAADPVGFIFTPRTMDRALGFATDLGMIAGDMMERLQRASALFIEANYDDELMQLDTTRPWSVKERIKSLNGHLSNAQAATAVGHLPELRKVILGHLSSATNTPERARSIVQAENCDCLVEVAYTPENKRNDKPQTIEIL